MGFNNIELITDREIEANLQEIFEVKRRFPDHAVIVSLMVETREEWKDLIKRSIDAATGGFDVALEQQRSRVDDLAGLDEGVRHDRPPRSMGWPLRSRPRSRPRLQRRRFRSQSWGSTSIACATPSVSSRKGTASTRKPERWSSRDP